MITSQGLAGGCDCRPTPVGGCQTQKAMLLRDWDLEVQRQAGEVLHSALPTPRGIARCRTAKTRLLGHEQQC